MVWHIPVASKTKEEINFWQKALVQARAYHIGIGQVYYSPKSYRTPTHRGFLESARRAGLTADFFLPIEFFKSAVEHTNIWYELTSKATNFKEICQILLEFAIYPNKTRVLREVDKMGYKKNFARTRIG